MDLNEYIFKNLVYRSVLYIRREPMFRMLDSLMASQYWSQKELYHHQEQQLHILLSHARATCTYYAASLPNEVNSLADISTIPLLDKSTLRSKSGSLRSSLNMAVTAKTSGGSTGAPVTVFKDKVSFASELAATWRGYRWAGIDIGQRQARFWGVPTAWRARLRGRLIDLISNRRRISAFRFSEKDMDRFLKTMHCFQPSHIYGYVSMLKEFSRFLVRHNRKVPNSIKAAFTTAEVLNHSDRKFLTEALKCSIYNEYGCGEVGTIAHECEKGSMHINDENVLIEIMKDGKPAPRGESGEIIVTDLTNCAMPLIRYRLMDFGMLATESCKCGRNLTVLSEVYGREYDFFINTKGDYFHGEFFIYIFEDLKRSGIKVEGFQIVQLDYDVINFYIMPTDSADIDDIIGKIQNYVLKKFDQNTTIDIRVVDKIAREKSGKLRVTKREFDTN